MTIESVDFARWFPQRWGCRGEAEVSLLDLTSQPFRKLDFGIAGETRCRFDAGIVVMQLNLEHEGPLAYRVPAMKYPDKTGHFVE